MVSEYIDIDRRWGVVLCYDLYPLDEYRIRENLMALGVRGHRIDEVIDTVLYQENTGYCVSVFDKQMSLCIIGNATSEEQWWDTLAHELYHVQQAVCEYYDVDSYSEDAAWTMGFLMRKAVRLVAPPCA
jgi:hypothetical protein